MALQLAALLLLVISGTARAAGCPDVAALALSADYIPPGPAFELPLSTRLDRWKFLDSVRDEASLLMEKGKLPRGFRWRMPPTGAPLSRTERARQVGEALSQVRARHPTLQLAGSTPESRELATRIRQAAPGTERDRMILANLDRLALTEARELVMDVLPATRPRMQARVALLESAARRLDELADLHLARSEIENVFRAQRDLDAVRDVSVARSGMGRSQIELDLRRPWLHFFTDGRGENFGVWLNGRWETDVAEQLFKLAPRLKPEAIPELVDSVASHFFYVRSKLGKGPESWNVIGPRAIAALQEASTRVPLTPLQSRLIHQRIAGLTATIHKSEHDALVRRLERAMMPPDLARKTVIELLYSPSTPRLKIPIDTDIPAFHELKKAVYAEYGPMLEPYTATAWGLRPLDPLEARRLDLLDFRYGQAIQEAEGALGGLATQLSR